MASLRQHAAIQSELQNLSRRSQPFLPAIMLCQRLALGLRRVRAEYLLRIEVWVKLALASLPPAPAAPLNAPGAQAPADLSDWLTSANALHLAREFRWALLPQAAALARLRSACPCGRTTDATLLQALHRAGLPILVHSQPSWGSTGPSWSLLIDTLSFRCRCAGVVAVQRISACWGCRGAVLPQGATLATACEARTSLFSALTAFACGSGKSLRFRSTAPCSQLALSQQRAACAADCNPGAGFAPPAAVSLPLRRVRRWLRIPHALRIPARFPA